MVNKKVQVLGVLLLIGGIVLFAVPDIADTIRGTKKTMQISQEDSGVLFTMKKSDQFLAFESGTSHKWKLTITNTGEIGWNNAWFTVRLGVPGATIQEVSAEDARALFEKFGFNIPDVYHGTYAVLSCSGQTDYIGCREFLLEQWNIRRSDGSSPDGYQERVASFALGSVNPGQSKSVDVVIDIPSEIEADSNRILLANGVCGTYARTTFIGYMNDVIDSGSISGNVQMQYLGIVLVLGGALLAFGRVI